MDASQRAAHAQQILSNPVFSEAFDMLRKHYTDRMIATSPEDSATRDHFHKSILALSDVKAALTACVERGKLEKAKTVQKEKIKKQKEKEQGSI